jgi:hypothetical protein
MVNKQVTHDSLSATSMPEFHKYWSELWESSTEHNPNAQWLKEEFTTNAYLPEMKFEMVSIDIFHKVIAKLHNWKSPGSDCVHNFFYKKLTHTHTYLYKHINNFILNPHTIPDYIMNGVTYM